MQLCKIKGQDNLVRQIVERNIKALSDIVNAEDFDKKFDENKSNILECLEKINTFTTEKDPIIDQSLLKSLDKIKEKAMNDQEISETNDKMLYNLLKLYEKAYKSGELAKKENGESDFVDFLLDIIKNKSHYRDPFLAALKIFNNMMLDKPTFDKLLESKIDESLIDALFNASDNYIDDIPVTSEINNALCMICSRSDKFAKYIVEKGGLQNIVEELRSLINLNDPVSQSKKKFGLKFIESLVKDESNMEKFIDLKGDDLIHNLMKSCLDQNKENEKNKIKDSIGNINDNNDDANKNYNKNSLALNDKSNSANNENDDKFGSEIIKEMNNLNKSELNKIEKEQQENEDKNQEENKKTIKQINNKVDNLNCFNNYITETCINIGNLGDSNNSDNEKDKNLSNSSLETNDDSNTSGSIDEEEDLFKEDKESNDGKIDTNEIDEDKKNSSNYLVHCFRIIMMNLKQNKKDFVDNRLFGNITSLLK